MKSKRSRKLIAAALSVCLAGGLALTPIGDAVLNTSITANALFDDEHVGVWVIDTPKKGDILVYRIQYVDMNLIYNGTEWVVQNDVKNAKIPAGGLATLEVEVSIPAGTTIRGLSEILASKLPEEKLKIQIAYNDAIAKGLNHENALKAGREGWIESSTIFYTNCINKDFGHDSCAKGHTVDSKTGKCTECDKQLKQPKNTDEKSSSTTTAEKATASALNSTASVDNISKAKTGAVVEVTGSKTSSIDTKTLTALVGKSVTLKIKNTNGSSVAINGKNVKATNSDVDLTVAYSAPSIPSKLVNQAKKAGSSSSKISFGKEGAFGFKANLTVKFSVSKAGKAVKLYRYDSKKNKLVLAAKGTVDETGYITFNNLSTGGEFIAVVQK